MKIRPKNIFGTFFAAALFFYLLFVLGDSLTQHALTAVLNLNYLLLAANAGGILFLLSAVWDRSAFKIPSRRWCFLLALPFLLLASYFIFRMGPGRQEYVYNFCRRSQFISPLTPPERIFKKEGQNECFVRLKSSLVYFTLEPVQANKILYLDIKYTSEAEKLNLGVEEQKRIRVLKSLPSSKGLGSWQKAEFRFNLKDLYMEEGKKLKLVFMAEELPKAGAESSDSGSYPEILIKEIKAALRRD